LWKKHQTQGIELIDIPGEIEEIWKFNGRLKVDLHKLKTKDQNKKMCWSSTRVNYIKLKILCQLGVQLKESKAKRLNWTLAKSIN